MDHPIQVHILGNTLIIYSLIRRPGPDTLADEAVGDEEDDERDEEVGKRKITRRTTGVKRNNFITRVFEIYFNFHTNH